MRFCIVVSIRRYLCSLFADAAGESVEIIVTLSKVSTVCIAFRSLDYKGTTQL